MVKLSCPDSKFSACYEESVCACQHDFPQFTKYIRVQAMIFEGLVEQSIMT